MKNILLFLALLVFQVCANAQNSYYPLQKGSTLIYAYGSELYEGAYDHIQLKISISNTTQVLGGKEYFVSETASGNGENYTVNRITYLREVEDGAIVSFRKVDAAESTVFPAYCEVGSSWNGIGSTTDNISVINLNGTITTPNATYTNCLVCEQPNGNGTKMRSYYQKDVGMVASTFVQKGEEQLFLYLVDQ